MFGPGVRLGLAALFGLALAVGGEVIRRTGYRVPLEGLAGAYVPGVLTAAGTFTLFGTVYAAHGVYGFIGPGPAFCLMGVIGIGTIALALVHGQALAGVGLLGSMVTPILVSSQSPNAWTLFGYLAIVLVANTAVARLRGWALLAAAGFAGAGLWQLLYLIPGQPVELGVVAFIDAAMLASLAVIWLRQRPASNAVPASALDWPSIVLAVFMAAAAVRLLLGPDLQAAGGATVGAAILVAMLLVALYRPPAVPLLHAAGAASVLVYAGTTLTGVVLLDFPGGTVALDAEPAFPVPATLRPAGTVLALAFLIAGPGTAAASWRTRRFGPLPGWGGAHWCRSAFSSRSGRLRQYRPRSPPCRPGAASHDNLIAAAEILARNERPPLAGGPAVSLALAGAGAASMLMLHMAFGSLWTTMLAGAAAIVPALATRIRSYPMLGWLAVGAAIVTVCRVAFDPTIVGESSLGRTPVFNALLPGYGIPALAFGLAAWQLARTTDGRRGCLEAAAVLFRCSHWQFVPMPCMAA